MVAINGIIQSPVRQHLRPVSTTLHLYVTMHLFFVNKTSHLALHSVTIKINECEANPGIMFPSGALSGRSAIAILQLCVDCTLEPSGMVTVSNVRCDNICYWRFGN